MKLTVAAAVGFLAANLVLSGQGPVKCDPNTPQGTDKEDYQQRDKPQVDRCEGIYQEKHNGVSHFVVVSLLPDLAPANQPNNKDVVIDWPTGLKGPLAVFVNHFGVSENYRLDAQVDVAKNAYTWPSRILTSHGIAIPNLSAAARENEQVDGLSTPVYIPVRINPTAPATVAWSSNFRLGLRVDTSIESAKYDLVYIGPPRKVLKTSQTISGGPFGRDYVLTVPLVLDQPGLYSFVMTASRDGLPPIPFVTYIRR
jgi:hypothetical protein